MLRFKIKYCRGKMTDRGWFLQMNTEGNMICKQLFAVTWFCTEVHSNSKWTKWTHFMVKHLKTCLFYSFDDSLFYHHSLNRFSSGQTLIKCLGLQPHNHHILKVQFIFFIQKKQQQKWIQKVKMFSILISSVPSSTCQ